MPVAAILSTGTEILQGLYPDTNAQWLSAQLAPMGIDIRFHIAAPDHPEAVADALRILLERADLVIMTGGLGPTEDDLNRQAIAEVFQCGLCEDAEAWRRIEERFSRRGGIPPRSNRIQCQIPDCARILQNDWGTAPGFVIESEKGMLIALPGPPRENRPMFNTYLRKSLAENFGGGHSSRVRTLHTIGISESKLNDALQPLFVELINHPTLKLALLAGEARVDVRMTAYGDRPTDVTRSLGQLVRRVKRRIPQDVLYGRDEETLESVVQELLTARGLTLSLAESCTGGLVAKRLTDCAGASAFLKESAVTYSNEAKQKRLGVKKTTLERFGAVSPETAREMALGSLISAGTDIAVSLTGIAGPDGGTKEKPVGLVWYGIAWRADAVASAAGVRCEKVGELCVATTYTCFPTVRELVRLFSSHRALDLVRRLVSGLPLEL